MHVHLPKPLHGWRAFLGEVGIIVLGVLIALAAEQFVEEMRWKDKVSRAEAAMRLELGEDDGPQAYGRVVIAPCLDALITRVHDGAGVLPAAQLRQLTLGYAPPFRVWDSEAWKAVLASDVGSHMGPERLVEWSSPYRLMPGLTDSNAREHELESNLQASVPPRGEPSSADLQELRRDSELLRAYNWQFYRASQLILARSRAVGAPVPQAIQRALVSQAQQIYGSCARAPDANAKPAAQALKADLYALPFPFGS